MPSSFWGSLVGKKGKNHLFSWQSQMKEYSNVVLGAVAQLARAPRSQRGGREFESLLLHRFAFLHARWQSPSGVFYFCATWWKQATCDFRFAKAAKDREFNFAEKSLWFWPETRLFLCGFSTSKIHDLYYHKNSWPLLFSPVGKLLGEFPKNVFEYEKCHEQRSGVVIQRKLLPLIFCLRRILTEGTSRRPFSRAWTLSAKRGEACFVFTWENNANIIGGDIKWLHQPRIYRRTHKVSIFWLKILCRDNQPRTNKGRHTTWNYGYVCSGVEVVTDVWVPLICRAKTLVRLSHSHPPLNIWRLTAASFFPHNLM